MPLQMQPSCKGVYVSEEERQERENELTKKLSLVETTHLMLLAL